MCCSIGRVVQRRVVVFPEVSGFSLSLRGLNQDGRPKTDWRVSKVSKELIGGILLEANRSSG